MASMDTLAAAMARKRRHPEDWYPNVRFIPGYGGFVQQQQYNRIAHDNSVPRWRSSTPVRKAPYRAKRRPRVSYD